MIIRRQLSIASSEIFALAQKFLGIEPMSSAGWKRAFCRAQDIEAEGEKYFEGFFKKSKTVSAVTDPVDENIKIARKGTDNNAVTKISDESTKSMSELTEPGETEDVDVERGGFCQPTGLASFFKDIFKKDSDKTGPADAVVDPALDLDLPVVVVRENGMARQICRAWLKNNFLNLGEACKNPDCERRHVIDSCSVGTLYKDYSFKGLTAAQRNSIIAQVQSNARKTVAKNTDMIIMTNSAVGSAVQEPESLKISKPLLPQSVDFSVKTDQSCRQKSSCADNDPKNVKSVSNDCQDTTSYIDSTKSSIKEVSGRNVKVTASSASSQGQPVGDKKLISNALNEKIDSENKTSATDSRLVMKKLRKPWMPLHKQITY